jgi:hypothetical protein
MARRPNYAQERNERNRAKQAKREAKLQQRRDASAERKATVTDPAGEPSPPPDEQA